MKYLIKCNRKLYAGQWKWYFDNLRWVKMYEMNEAEILYTFSMIMSQKNM